MKERIQRTGALASSVHFSGLEQYYNYETGALYYNGLDYSNHAITIVGWDDEFSSNDFLDNKAVGAWIIKNSWGTDWGYDGFGYLSYQQHLGFGYTFIFDDDGLFGCSRIYGFWNNLQKTII